MFKLILLKINVFIVFRSLSYLVGSVALLCVVLFAAYLLEPKANLDNQKLEVIRTYWAKTIGRSGVSGGSFHAEIVLPNGNMHTFTTYPNRVVNDYVCAEIELGKWLKSYHINIVEAHRCSV